MARLLADLHRRGNLSPDPADRPIPYRPAGSCAYIVGMTIILGLESSCDETAAALVTGDREILSHKLAGQEDAHRP